MTTSAANAASGFNLMIQMTNIARMAHGGELWPQRLQSWLQTPGGYAFMGFWWFYGVVLFFASIDHICWSVGGATLAAYLTSAAAHLAGSNFEWATGIQVPLLTSYFGLGLGAWIGSCRRARAVDARIAEHFSYEDQTASRTRMSSLGAVMMLWPAAMYYLVATRDMFGANIGQWVVSLGSYAFVWNLGFAFVLNALPTKTSKAAFSTAASLLVLGELVSFDVTTRKTRFLDGYLPLVVLTAYVGLVAGTRIWLGYRRSPAIVSEEMTEESNVAQYNDEKEKMEEEVV